jgi:hypothetical protein
MAAIPSFVLKKLYVAGSLCNTADGCQFQLKNTLAPATITGLGPLVIDGTACDAADVVLLRGSERLVTAQPSKNHPVAFDVNALVTVVVKNRRLEPGGHRIHVDVNSKEAGRLAWDISDKLAG